MLEHAEPESPRSVRESMPLAAAPMSRAASAGTAPGRALADRASGTGSRPSFDTGPLPGSRSARRKKGLFRRTGIIFPAIGVAAVIVALFYFASSYLMGPNGSGASGLAPVFNMLPHSNSIAMLEAEREQLIVMSDAASTLSQGAKPTMVSPSSVMAAAAASSAAAAGSGSGSSGSSDSGSQQVVQAAAPDPGTAQHIGYEMLPQFGFNQTTEWTCLLDLWNQESGWRYDAYNPSGAYGIPQSLPGDKMASAGADWQTNPATQIKWGLGYITDVYSTPCGAWDHEVADGWY